MGVRQDNSTGYVHNDEPNLLNIHKAMDYNAAGYPVVRTTGNTYDWTINLSAGQIDNTGYVEKFGRTTTITANVSTVWDGAGIYSYLGSAETVEISATGNDTPTGSGANTIEIQGLDENYVLQTEEIPTDGTPTTVTFIRVFRALVKTAGATGSNENEVEIRSSDTNTLLALIDVEGTGGGSGLGQTFMCVYTVPAGKTAYLTQWIVGCGSQNADTTATFVARPFGGAFNTKDIMVSAGQLFNKDYKVPLQFTEKTDLEVRIFGGGTQASSTFNLILIDN